MKALGIAMKLTLQGQNQLVYPQTSVFAMVVVVCVLTQMNYLNKVPALMLFESALSDRFNTSLETAVYDWHWHWHYSVLSIFRFSEASLIIRHSVNLIISCNHKNKIPVRYIASCKNILGTQIFSH